MLLTGDTAQTITKGVSFRFEDVATMLHTTGRAAVNGAAEAIWPTTGNSTAASKDRLHPHAPKLVEDPAFEQLTENYRSHRGILGAASALVAAITKLAPHSIDKLKPDRGMLAGPKITIISGGNASELAKALKEVEGTGDAQVDFGAKQAILVANEEAKGRLPPELRSAPAYTTPQAKGLEMEVSARYA